VPKAFEQECAQQSPRMWGGRLVALRFFASPKRCLFGSVSGTRPAPLAANVVRDPCDAVCRAWGMDPTAEAGPLGRPLASSCGSACRLKFECKDNWIATVSINDAPVISGDGSDMAAVPVLRQARTSCPRTRKPGCEQGESTACSEQGPQVLSIRFRLCTTPFATHLLRVDWW
jgi:hypothetical protein